MNDLRRLFALTCRPQRAWLLATVLLATLAAGAATGLVATAGWLLTASAITGAVLAAGGVARLEIFGPGALIRLFAVTRTVARYAERLIGHESIFRLLTRLRPRVFAGLAAQSWPVIGRLRRALVLNRLIGDVEALEGFPAGMLSAALAVLLAGGAFSIVLAWLLPEPIAWAGLVLTLLLAGLPVLAGWRAQPREYRAALLRERLQRDLLERLAASRELVFADPADHRRHALARLDARLAAAAIARASRASAADATGVLILHLSLCGLLAVLAGWLAAGAISPARAGLAILGLLALAGITAGLAESWQGYARTRLGLRRLGIEAVATLSIAEHRHGAPGVAGGRPVEWPAGGDAVAAAGWRLDAVGLSQGVADRPVLDGLMLDIAPGEVITITGRSGSGKSSLLALLAGLRRPDEGQVLLDGRAASDWPERVRFSRIAVCEQRTTLLAGTLADNLALGIPGGAEPGELQAALSAVGLDELAGELDTWLGPGGRELSGGEARRVAVLRAALCPAGALLLDEPFRGLDDTASDALSRWLAARWRGRTVVVFDHVARGSWPDRRVLTLAEGRL